MGVVSDFIRRLTGRGTPPQETTLRNPNPSQQSDICPRVDVDARTLKLEKAINIAKNGFNIPEDMLNSFEEPTLAIKIATSIGVELSSGWINDSVIHRVGGIMNIYNEMKKDATNQARAYNGKPENFIPSSSRIVSQMLKTSLKKQLDRKLEIDRNKEPYLNQVCNSALERLGQFPPNLAVREDYVLERARERGCMEITCEGDNANITKGELKAAIRLAQFRHNGSVKEDDIRSLGGPAAVIQVMVAKAEYEALENKTELKFLQDSIPHYLGSPIDIIREMMHKKELGR